MAIIFNQQIDRTTIKKITGGLRKFWETNKKRPLLYAGAFLLLVIAAGSSYYLTAGRWADRTGAQAAKSAATPSAGQAFSVLPETRRQTESAAKEDLTGTQDGTAPVNDPFAGPVILRGTITGEGENLAIIEAGGTTLIVRVNEKVAGYWTVQEILDGKVVLTADDQELQLGPKGKVIRKLKLQKKTGEIEKAGEERR